MLLFSQKGCFLVQQEEMCSCSTRQDLFSSSEKRHVLLFNKILETGLVGQQEDKSSCSKRRHVFLLSKKTCLLVALVFAVMGDPRGDTVVTGMGDTVVTGIVQKSQPRGGYSGHRDILNFGFIPI